MLLLRGTVPVWYKGNTYNIPVDIWVTENYPTQPPTCFVTPTSDMMVKPGHQHVGADGMCYLPFLTEWATKPWRQENTILQLICELRDVFTQQMPVYQKPQNQPPSYHQPRREPPPPPNPTPPPRPPSWQQPSHQSPAMGVGPPPGYPGDGRRYGESPAAVSPRTTTSPPFDPGPQRFGEPPPQYPQQAMGRPSYTNPPPDPWSGAAAQRERDAVDPAKQAQKRQKEEINAKLRQIAEHLSKELEKEMVPLVETNEKLETGRALLEADEARLSQLERELREGMEKVMKTQDALAALPQVDDEEPSLEDLIVFENKRSKQLVETVAEDHAIQDTYLVLDKALANQATDIDTFLLTTRQLATKQFMLRALGNKIIGMQEATAQRQAAGAAPSVQAGGYHGVQAAGGYGNPQPGGGFGGAPGGGYGPRRGAA